MVRCYSGEVNRQSRFGRFLLLIMAVVLSVSMLVAAPAPSQFTPFARGSQSILEGNWQSCREADGRYSERVYDHVVNGAGQFEVHMGPRNEFAIFERVQDEHRDHASSDNLLSPYRVAMESGRARQRWEIPQHNLALTVTLAGGSRTDCDSWFVLLEPLKKPSH
jgi:hypothetical protein